MPEPFSSHVYCIIYAYSPRVAMKIYINELYVDIYEGEKIIVQYSPTNKICRVPTHELKCESETFLFSLLPDDVLNGELYDSFKKVHYQNCITRPFICRQITGT
jgi:hypothetical protein